jgi:hypothetical protein
MDVDNTRQGVFCVGATLDGDSEDGLGLLDSDSEIPLLVGHDKCTLRDKHHPMLPTLCLSFHAVNLKLNVSYEVYSALQA